ncbi:hypothetical protein Aperf_G00000115338 [Anoplocephala perfoliata]
MATIGRHFAKILTAVEFRLACPGDEPAIKRLCVECFPVRYPDVWYTELVSSGCYITVLASFNQPGFPIQNNHFDYADNVIGLIVAEYRSLNNCKISDRTILHPRIASESMVMYILSLAVTSQYRECGIGSLLLSMIIDHAKRQKPFLGSHDPCNRHLLLNCNCYDDVESKFFEQSLSPHQLEFVQSLRQQHRTQLPCRAIYLHTECTNYTALKFYQRRGFVLHRLIPRCYIIEGRAADGYCCVLHINDGYPHRSLLQECLHWLCRKLHATKVSTVALIGQTVLRLKATFARLHLMSSDQPIRMGSSKTAMVVRWRSSQTARASPDPSKSPLLIHSL